MRRNTKSVLLDIHVVILTAFECCWNYWSWKFRRCLFDETFVPGKKTHTVFLFYYYETNKKSNSKQIDVHKNIRISGINNNDSIRKQFDFSLKMLTNLWLAEFRQRLKYIHCPIIFPLLLQICSFFWRIKYWQLSDAKYWTICKIFYPRMTDSMILEVFLHLQFPYIFYLFFFFFFF